MLTPYGSSGISSVGRPKTYYTNHKPGAVRTTVSHNYDSADFSSVPEGKSAFHMNVVSRLSQEVRTSTTTGDIQELRRAVSAGEYTPDPMGIARGILLMAED